MKMLILKQSLFDTHFLIFELNLVNITKITNKLKNKKVELSPKRERNHRKLYQRKKRSRKKDLKFDLLTKETVFL